MGGRALPELEKPSDEATSTAVGGRALPELEKPSDEAASPAVEGKAHDPEVLPEAEDVAGATADPCAWQELATTEANELACEVWELPCISCAHLLEHDAVPGSATLQAKPGAAAPAGLEDAARPKHPPRPLPSTNQPTRSEAPPPPTEPDLPELFTNLRRTKLKRNISLDDIYVTPSRGTVSVRTRIARWLSKARDYHRSVLKAAHHPGVRLLRRPSDYAIALEDLLKPAFRPFIWDTRDPLNVFALREDSCPFRTDSDVRFNAEWICGQASRLGFEDLDLLHQLQSGISGNHTSPADRTTLLCCNAASYVEFAAQTDDELQDELAVGWSSLHKGEHLPFAPAKCQPQGSVPKRAGSKKRRRTSNFSKSVPHGADNSVNSTVDASLLPQFKMPSTYSFASAVDTLARGSGDSSLFGVAVDISAAYRQLRYADHVLWENLWCCPEGIVVEARLSFGQAASANVFQRLSNLIVLIVRDAFDRAEAADPLPEAGDPAFWQSREPGAQSRRGYCQMFIDDPVAVAISKPRATRLGSVIAAVLARCGLGTSPKSQGPTGECLRVLGLDFVLDDLLVSCPIDKQQRLDDKISDLLYDSEGRAKKVVRRRELRSVAGSLNFVAPAHPGMRPFLNSAFRAGGARASKKRDGFVTVSDALRTDLTRAQELLRSPSAQAVDLAFQRKFVNGMLCGIPSARPGYGEWSSDAAGGSDAKLAIFCRGMFATHECSPDEARYLSIGLLEGLAAHAGLVSFTKSIRGAVLVALNDNAGVVQAVNTGRCRNPALAECVSEIAAVAAAADCLFGLNHVRSAENTASDALSRSDSETFAAFCRREGYEPRAIAWPQETVELSARLVAISQQHYATRGFCELADGPPGIVSAPGFRCDVELSAAEQELARSNGELSFM